MFDVAIIGAGVIGSCAARELSQFNLKIVVLEKKHDVAQGSSKANSGIVHGGYDAKPGTQKAKYNVLGQQMFDKLAAELGFPFRRNGSLVISDETGIDKLEVLKNQGIANGLTDLRIIHGEELRRLEPNLGDKVHAALVVPGGGIVCPYAMTIAFAENAAANGVQFMLGCTVLDIKKEEGSFSIVTSRETINAQMVVNAAGLHSDEINNLLSSRKLKIVPRRGEYCLLDKTEGKLVQHTIFQLPTKMGKGVLVTPTVDGNLLLGPTSEDIDEKDNTATTANGLNDVLQRAQFSLNHLPANKIISSFTGLRSTLVPEGDVTNDFIVEEAADVPGLINLCGIESPGLTAAPAIAVETARMIADRLKPAVNENFNPLRKGIRHFREMSNEERKTAIQINPDYGHVICRCESVTKAEILAALRSPLSKNNNINCLDAIKRRTRAGMGRCQSGFCWMRLIDIIAEECGIDVTEVSKSGGRSNILVECNKSGMR
ncbi:MAG: NAD(P)/FAD-dependent oxidoreductase [Planctomycetaceae bacterium]|nr:NAD(P)/FAD-dependent oxidoreductase [Planctomycetaceae bacterium]